MENKKFDKKVWLPRILVVIAVLIVCALLAQKKFYALLLSYIGIYAIIVTGLDVLTGYSGQLSFGQAGFYAIGAYTSALLSKNFGWNPFLTTLIGAILSVGVSLIIAGPASRLRKHFLSVFTTAFGLLINALVGKLEFTGAATGIMKIPNYVLFGYEFKSRQASLVLIGIVFAILLFVKYRIVNSRTGRAFIAVKENPMAARGMGIDVQKYKILAFAVAAFYAGIAGGLYAHLINFISPETFSSTTATLCVTMLIFGGKTSLIGPILGAAIIIPVKEAFQSMSIYQGVVFGLFMIVALFFFPSGLVGLYADIKKKIAARKSSQESGKEAGTDA